MFSLILSVVLLALFLGNSGAHASKIDGRIHGGEVSSVNERYVMPLRGRMNCGMAVLNEQWMLATSYCLHVNRWQNGETRNYSKTITMTTAMYQDFALIKFSRPLPDVEMGLFKAIPLPDLDEDLKLTDNTEATIYGVKEMQKMNMTLKTGDECKKFYQSHQAYYYTDYICMEVTEEKTTCAGDDGALMVVDGKLAALATVARVVSSCPSAATYQLFVKISPIRGWIHAITNL